MFILNPSVLTTNSHLAHKEHLGKEWEQRREEGKYLPKVPGCHRRHWTFPLRQRQASNQSWDFRWMGSTQFIWHTQCSKLPRGRILTSRRGKANFQSPATPTENTGMDRKSALTLQCPPAPPMSRCIRHRIQNSSMTHQPPREHSKRCLASSRCSPCGCQYRWLLLGGGLGNSLSLQSPAF